MSDGPHGIRKQDGGGDHLGINASRATTCFPTASAAAASWDRDLLYQMGEAIALEAIQAGVNVDSLNRAMLESYDCDWTRVPNFK
jgi:beta-glucosidase